MDSNSADHNTACAFGRVTTIEMIEQNTHSKLLSVNRSCDALAVRVKMLYLITMQVTVSPPKKPAWHMGRIFFKSSVLLGWSDREDQERGHVAYMGRHRDIVCNISWRPKKKVKSVKRTLVQALRLCTGCTAQRGNRGIALLFLDHGTRKGWGVSVRPRPLFTPGKTRYPLYRRLGVPQGQSGQVRKISPPPGFDPRTV